MDFAPRRPTDAQPAETMHQRLKPARPGAIDLRISRPQTTNQLPTPTLTSKLPPLTRPVVTLKHDTPAAPPKSTVSASHQASYTERFDRAKRFSRNPEIKKFYDQFGNKTLFAKRGGDFLDRHNATGVVPQPTVPGAQPAHPAYRSLELPKYVESQHQAMASLARPSASTLAIASTRATPAWRPGLSLTPRTTRALSLTAAIMIMSGYVWLQNYPKLAISDAGSKAGLSATMPGYLPSSYNLAHTDTAPGLVTLSFHSPSAPDALTIAQHATTWDSSSLLDNFIAKNADSYSAVQGQGLTIYVFNNNQASWVNHGVWYSIAGAAKLSREQILKIAYSL